MSREIKFRAWDIDNKKYEYDIAIRPINRIIGVEIFNNEMYPVEFRGIVEQYTGLKDKNGKEIYEGDIVKWLDGLNEYIGFKVEWQDNRARFCLRNEYSVFDYEDLNDKKEPYIEIIGNIHENPELLEDK